MNKQENINLLKKISIVKAHLLIENSQPEKIITIIDELFTENIPIEIINARSIITKGNKLQGLNLINSFKNTISELIFKNPCSKQWDKLIETNSYDKKYCSDCRQNVYLVSTEKEMIKRRNLGHCVALNLAEVRISNDNDEYYKACHIKFQDELEMGLPG